MLRSHIVTDATHPALDVYWVNQFAVPPDQPGGTRHYDFASELGRRGHRVHLVASDLNLTTRRYSRRRRASDVRAIDEEIDGMPFTWLTAGDAVAEIRRRRASGTTMEEVAAAVGVSRNSVSRALAAGEQAAPVEEEEDDERALVPLAPPEPRTEEREAARCGALAGAAPVTCEGGSLPLAGALVILPALAATGLLDVANEVYGRARAAFYGLGSLLLTIVFAALVGEPRAEGGVRTC